MGTTELAVRRLSCSVEHCDLNFSSQRELHRHEEELHGELRRRLQACCGSPGAASVKSFETHDVKEQAHNVMSSVNPKGRSSLLAEDKQEAVIVDEDSKLSRERHEASLHIQNVRSPIVPPSLTVAVPDSREQFKAFPSLNNSSEEQSTTPAPARQIVSIPHNRRPPEAAATEPPHIHSYNPLPEGCRPRIFEGTHFGGACGV